jgi:2-iminobutanoate/2-iminopropanoate deaminase
MTSATAAHRLYNEGDQGFAAVTILPLGASNLLLLSGEVGRDTPAHLVPGGVEAESRQCFANIKKALARCGATLSDIVKTTVYLRDLKDYPHYAKVRAELFPAERPASTCIGVADLLLGAGIEIDVTAIVSAAP